MAFSPTANLGGLGKMIIHKVSKNLRRTLIRSAVAGTILVCFYSPVAMAEELIHTPIGNFTKAQIDKMKAYEPLDEPECQDDPHQNELNKPMTFFDKKSEKCLGNAVSTATNAIGVITHDTPDLLTQYIAQHQAPQVLELTSTGGDLLAAMRLGEIIRKNNINTSLGEVCACAYAFIGGMRRYAVTDTTEIPDYVASGDDYRFVGASGDKFGVHQFYENEAIANLNAPAFTGKDRLDDQVTMAQVIDYTIRMGVKPEMVILASQVPPNQIRWLSATERAQLNIDNTTVHDTELTIFPFGSTGSYAGVTNDRQGDENSLRIYCRSTSNDIHMALVFDYTDERGKNDTIDILKLLTANLKFDNSEERKFPLEVVGNGKFKDGTTERFSVAMQIHGLPKNMAPHLTHVSFSDEADQVGRAQEALVYMLKFRIRGDKRYLGLTMRNCIQ